MSGDPYGTPAWRRRLGVGVLATGALLIAVTAGRDVPREQPLVFRLDRPLDRGGRLTASFTRVGDAEANVGFTLELPPGPSRNVTHKVRLPNGDYIVTVDVAGGEPTENVQAEASGPSARAGETSARERVTLSGSEVVVPVREQPTP